MISKIKQLGGGWKFLISMCLIYLAILVISYDAFVKSMIFFYKIILKILPVFVFVFFLMFIVNLFVSPNHILHIEKNKFRKWLLIIVAGILSTGPIYMWYPLLAELKKKGLSYGAIACFLYIIGR